jgi:hypothetical protein
MPGEQKAVWEIAKIVQQELPVSQNIFYGKQKELGR